MEDTKTAYRELVAKPMDAQRRGPLAATASEAKKAVPSSVSAAVRREYNRMLETLNEAQVLEASRAFTRR